MQAQPQTVAPVKPKVVRKPAAKLAQDLAYKALRSKGLTQEAAAKLIGIHPSSASRYEKRLKDEAAAAGQPDPIQPLMSQDRDEKLGRLVDHFLDKGLKLRKVKGSDAIAAGKLYADRRYPVRSDPAPASINFTTVNLIEIANPSPTRYCAEPPRELDAGQPGSDNPPITLDITPPNDGPIMGIMSNE